MKWKLFFKTKNLIELQMSIVDSWCVIGGRMNESLLFLYSLTLYNSVTTLKTLKKNARTSYFPPPFFVKLELCRLCMSMPNTICADREFYPWIILLCAVLRAVICDKSWKWTESFVISSSKHELCFHVFHPWSLLHFRSHQAWLVLAAQWTDCCFALKPVIEVCSSWLSPLSPYQTAEWF